MYACRKPELHATTSAAHSGLFRHFHKDTFMELKKILLVSLGHLSCDINGGALPALLIYLAAAHDLDYQTCGTLAFAYAAMSSIIQPVFGLVADRWSRSWFIPLGIVLAGCGLGATGFMSDYRTIFLALMVCGVGGAVFHPEGARYANLVSGSHKGIGLSIFSVGGNSGFVIGPLLVMLFVGGIPLTQDFMLGGFGLPGTAAFTVIALCMALFLYWNISRWNLTAAAPKAAARNADLRNDWPAFGILSGTIIARSILFLSFNTYLPLYWKNIFNQPAQVGNAMLAFFCIFGVISNLLGGMAADRWGFRRTIRCAGFFTLPFLTLFPFVENPWLAALLLIPIAIGLYAPFSSMVVLGQRYLARNMGFASGITLGVAMSIGGMATPVLGWVADNYGGLPAAMHVLAVVTLCGAISTLFLKESK